MLNEQQFIKWVNKHTEDSCLEREKLDSLGIKYIIIPCVKPSLDYAPGEENAYLMIKLEDGLFNIPVIYYSENSFGDGDKITFVSEDVEEIIEKTEAEIELDVLNNAFVKIRDMILNL